MKKIKDICEFMWHLEKKFNLMELEIDGVKVWQYKRMAIYYQLAEAAGVIESPHIKMSKYDHCKSLVRYFKNSIMHNPLLMPKANVLVIPHERTKEYEGQQVDIYTHFLSEDLKSKGKTVLELERPYLGKHNKSRDKLRFYADFFILISNFLKKLIKLKIDAISLQTIAGVEKEIEKKLGLKIKLTEQFVSYAKRFKINYWLYSYILKKTSVEHVYCVVGYAYGDLIRACKDLNIPVTEVQHGTFSDYHLGYSFPDREEELDYFPTNFMVWNDFWKNLIKLPLSGSAIKVRKFDYLEKLRGEYEGILRIKNKMVVISQGALTESIAAFILDNLILFKGLSIHYKLHPGEFKTWRNSKSLAYLVDQEIVSLEINSDLYQLFSECEYQVGVFSTAIYEGKEFGCKTILLDLPGIEYMKEFIKKNNLKFMDGIYCDI